MTERHVDPKRVEPNDVFDLLVEADPVPDPHTIRADRAAAVVSLHPVRTGREPMQTISTDDELTTPPPERGRRSWMLAAAAAVILLLGVGALLVIDRGDDGEDPVDQPATTPVPTAAPEEDASSEPTLGPEDEPVAMATTYEFYRAINAGDAERVEELMRNPDADEAAADRRMFEMNAVLDANGKGLELTENCEVLATTSAFIDVGCAATMTDPVWVALDVSELTAPGRYFADGTVRWIPYKTASGADFTQANLAYSTYLREFHPDEYAAVCDPTAFPTGTVGSNQALVFTAECAELWVPLQDDVAAWVVETGFGS